VIRFLTPGLQAVGRPAPIVFEDELTVAIEDQRPKAARHILLFSREPIQDVDALTAAHAPLVEHMANVGAELLNTECPANVRFGFHRSPFHSVEHLHMHCIALPFAPAWQVTIYNVISLRSSRVFAIQGLRFKPFLGSGFISLEDVRASCHV
jgi:diadenosine tetraphosphate (Ap4A) HIT family hydrolase